MTHASLLSYDDANDAVDVALGQLIVDVCQ